MFAYWRTQKHVLLDNFHAGCMEVSAKVFPGYSNVLHVAEGTHAAAAVEWPCCVLGRQ